MANYYLVVSDRNASRAEKLRDCKSDLIELAEHEAVEEFKKRRVQEENVMVRVVEESTRIVVFAVHKDNIGNQ